MILHALPNQGGGILFWWWRNLVDPEVKRKVDANSEEVKQIEDKNDNTKLTVLLFMRM